MADPQATIPDLPTVETFTVGASPATGPFGFSFTFFDPAEIKVRVGETELSYPAEYSVVGNTGTVDGFQGGNVTLVAAVSSVVVTVNREIVRERIAQQPLAGGFDVSAFNIDMNRIVGMVQEIQEAAVARALSYDITVTDAAGAIVGNASERANKVVGFDGAGALTSLASIDGVTASPWGAAWVQFAGSNPARANLMASRTHEAARAPTVNDDAPNAFCYVGDYWRDTAGGVLYLCTDSSDSAAVWVKVSTLLPGLNSYDWAGFFIADTAPLTGHVGIWNMPRAVTFSNTPTGGLRVATTGPVGGAWGIKISGHNGTSEIDIARCTLAAAGTAASWVAIAGAPVTIPEGQFMRIRLDGVTAPTAPVDVGWNVQGAVSL